MRILYLWICLCVCGLWSHTAVAERLFVYSKNAKEFLVVDANNNVSYIPPDTAYVTLKENLTFYALSDINKSISNGENFVQFDGIGKDYVALRFFEFWDYINDNYSAYTVSVLEYSYDEYPMGNSTIKMMSDNYVLESGHTVEYPWTYYDGNSNQTIFVKPRKVTDWDWSSARLKLTVEGRIPDSDASYDPYTDALRENFGSMYQISFMDYPYRYYATVNPTPRTPQRWSDTKLSSLSRKYPNEFNGTLLDQSVIDEIFIDVVSTPDDTFQQENVWDWVQTTPDELSNSYAQGLDGDADDGVVIGTDEARDATLLDVVDAINDLELELPEQVWEGIEYNEDYGEFYDFEASEWLPDDTDVGSGIINVPTAFNGASIPSYLTIGEYSIPLGAMFSMSPMAELCQWAKLLFEMGIYFGFAFIVINDVRELLIGASNQSQVTGNSELHGGVVFAEVSTRLPSVLTNHLMIMGALLALSGALLGVASSGIVPNWNFTEVVQTVFSASPYIIQLAFGFIDPFFPTELMASMTVGLLAFKVLSLTTYGIATLAIKSASA